MRISSVIMVYKNLVGGSLKNIFRMQQYKWMIHQKKSHTPIHTHYHMFVLMALMWIQYAKKYKSWVARPMSNAINTDYLSLNLKWVQTNVNVAKNEFLRCCEFSCRALSFNRCFENIDTDIKNVFQSSDYDYKYSNNYNKYSDVDSDYS